MEFRPFYLRFAAEAAARAACTGGVFVLPVWLVFALVRRVSGFGSAPLSLLAALAWAALSAALYFLCYRPTKRQIARRLDALCGMDRAATAVEFAGSESVLCRMQREDTARHLAAVDAKALRIRLPFSAMAACAVLLALILAVPHIPQSAAERARAYALRAFPALAPQESEESAALRAMIGSLRSEIEGAGLEEADRNQLLARLDELLERLGSGHADISALQEIQTAMDGMQQTLQELTPRDTYMAAMIEFESLRLLGEAIFDENMDVVEMILDSMGRQLNEKQGAEQIAALMELAYDVNASLAKPLRDNGQEQLRQGMMMFSNALEAAAEMAYSGRDTTRMIATALDTAETYIREYLGVPLAEDRYDPYADRVYEPGAQSASAAAGLSVAAEKPLSRSETEYVYNPPEALRAGGYTPGALDENGAEQRIAAEQRERPTGAVPYGEVYSDYYAAYLRQLADEAFPQELLDAAQTYINGL